MRVVLDTNILLSGLLWKGVPGKIIDLWQNGLFEIVVSDEVFAEYAAVLRRFTDYQSIDVDEIMQTVGERAIWCTAIKLAEPLCSDPDDDKFVAAAVSGSARHVVSGDKALLAVRSFAGVEILTAKRFLSLLQG